ncbi:probable RNA methyltransferase Y17G7B.18 [Saccostrea echinata]|uniref:probable RNA methyltransferase Y17G7B.18 n=1 Tax=Saccostrea echinata TaxID=191078 RepID=UPI002A821119|nr:probable RNA methyltransferase Y17G7B.18 [Saccostrea echinata]
MSVEVKTPTRTQFEHTEFQCGEKTTPELNYSAEDDDRAAKFDFKKEQDSQSKSQNIGYRKRKASHASKNDLTIQHGGYRKKRFRSESNIVLPTKFLLGGNINDPLNLNSLNDETINELLNQKTPQSSPLPTPHHRKDIEVTIPININDPLNLDSNEDVSSNKKKKRNKHKRKSEDAPLPQKESEKRRGLMEALKIEIDDTFPTAPVVQEDSPQNESVKLKFKKPDTIVSPVIPQISPSSRRFRRRTLSMSDARPDQQPSQSTSRSILRTSLSPPRQSALEIEDFTPGRKFRRQVSQKSDRSQKKNRRNKKFIYGNYNRYYGYRNPDAEEDPRLECMRGEWFEGKDVLDIGCNVGHVTLTIGKRFHPRKVVGIDIDHTLIAAARKNIRNYMSNKSTEVQKYPLSVPINYGPIAAPAVSHNSQNPGFPANVAFMKENYVLESDELVDLQHEEYDVIMALSLTKWIHLNFGDSGLKRFFRRIFKHLRPGGRLILEPQPWSSYKKKKKISEEIQKTFQEIQMRPAQFSDYLLSREVGFTTCEVIDIPYHKSKGFRRPIQMYRKQETAHSSPKQDLQLSQTATIAHSSPKQDQLSQTTTIAHSSPKQDQLSQTTTIVQSSHKGTNKEQFSQRTTISHSSQDGTSQSEIRLDLDIITQSENSSDLVTQSEIKVDLEVFTQSENRLNQERSNKSD